MFRTKEELLAAIDRGERPEFLFFWGHRQSPSGAVTKSCFSQWYPAAFEESGIRYATAEHYMMAHKAELFGDLKSKELILATSDPRAAKDIGRGVSGFVDAKWLAHRWSIVVNANKLKFSQNARLLEFLKSTGEKVLVEASPTDAVWGIGLAADAPEAANPKTWPGLNLLGFALMQVRDALKASRGES